MRVSATLALSLLPLAACSLLVGPDAVQCSTDGDCQSRGGSFAATSCVASRCVEASSASDAALDATPEAAMDAASSTDGSLDGSDGGDPWSCLGKVTAPAEDTSKMVTLNFKFVDSALSPLSGMTAAVCNRSDLTCSSPIVASQTSDAMGNVSMQVPYAARVYVSVTGKMVLKTLVYVDPPPTVAQGPVTSVVVQTSSTLQTLSALASHSFNNREGALFLLAQDCSFAPAGGALGVQFELTPGGDAGAADTVGFYTLSGTPDFALTETTSSGNGGFLNVLPGLTTVTGVLPGRGNAVVGRNAVLVQPNTVTYAVINAYEM
jgi:hypothetical protein